MASERKRKRPRWKRRLAVGGAAVVALLVIAGLAPTFVNLGLGRESIRRAIERRVGAEVAFADLRVGWFGSQRVEDLTLTADDGREVARVDVRVDRGLLGLALGAGRLQVAVRGVLRSGLRADGSLGIRDDLRPPRRGRARAGSASPALSGVPAATLALEGLRVELLDELRREPAVLESVTGSIEYAPGDVVNVSLSSATSSRAGPGSVAVEARLKGLVSERGALTPWAASGDVSIAAAHLAVPLTTRNIVLRSARISATSPGLRDRLTLDLSAEAVIDGSVPGSAWGRLIVLSPVDEDGYVNLSADNLAGRITALHVPTAPLQLLLPARTPLRMDRDLGSTVDLDASFTDRVTVTLRSDTVRLEAAGAIDRASGRLAGDRLQLAASLAPELVDACTGLGVAAPVAFEVNLDSFSLPRDPAAAAFSGTVSVEKPVAVTVPGGSTPVPVGPARIGLRTDALRGGLSVEGTAEVAGADATLAFDLAGIVAAGDTGEAPAAWPLRLEPSGGVVVRGLQPATAARLFPGSESVVTAAAEGPVDVTVRSAVRDERLTASVQVVGAGIDLRGDASREPGRITLGPVHGRLMLSPELARALQEGLARSVTVLGKAEATIDLDPLVLKEFPVGDSEGKGEGEDDGGGGEEADAPQGAAFAGYRLPASVTGRVSAVDLALDVGELITEPFALSPAEPFTLSVFSAAVQLDREPVRAVSANGTAHLRTVAGGQSIGLVRFDVRADFGGPASQSVQLDLRDLSAHGLERMAGTAQGALAQWIGPGGWGTVELVRRGESLDLTVAPTFPRLAGRFQINGDPRMVSVVTERTNVTIDRELVQRRMSPKVGAAPVTVRGDVPLSLAMRLRVPRAVLAKGGAFEPADALVDLELTGGPVGLADASGATATLRSALLKLESQNLARGVTLTMTAQVEQPGGRDGTLRADGTLGGFVKKAAPAQGRQAVRSMLSADDAGLDLAVEARQMPTAIVDALCEWNGLLIAAVGDRFDGEASARRFWLDRGTIGLKLRSPSATLEGLASGRSAGRNGRGARPALVISPASPLEASLELTPPLRDRLLVRIHPLLADVRAVERRPAMKVTSASVPLDGDPARLDADIEVTVGKVEFDSGSLGLALLAAAHASNAATIPGEIEPVKARIRSGILTYDRFAMHLDKYTLVYSGRIDLTTGTVDLRTEIPLSGLAQSIEELRGYADLIVVPLVTRGRFGALRTEIDPQFDLVGAAIQAGFRGGLGDLLKDATKDTGFPIDEIFEGIFGRKKKN